jgi:hypothetical protein
MLSNQSESIEATASPTKEAPGVLAVSLAGRNHTLQPRQKSGLCARRRKRAKGSPKIGQRHGRHGLPVLRQMETQAQETLALLLRTREGASQGFQHVGNGIAVSGIVADEGADPVALRIPWRELDGGISEAKGFAMVTEDGVDGRMRPYGEGVTARALPSHAASRPDHSKRVPFPAKSRQSVGDQ